MAGYLIGGIGVVVAALGLAKAWLELRKAAIGVRMASQDVGRELAAVVVRLDCLERRVRELGRSVGGIRDDQRTHIAALHSRQTVMEERMTQWLT